MFEQLTNLSQAHRLLCNAILFTFYLLPSCNTHLDQTDINSLRFALVPRVSYQIHIHKYTLWGDCHDVVLQRMEERKWYTICFRAHSYDKFHWFARSVLLSRKKMNANMQTNEGKIMPVFFNHYLNFHSMFYFALLDKVSFHLHSIQAYRFWCDSIWDQLDFLKWQKNWLRSHLIHYAVWVFLLLLLKHFNLQC